MKLKVILPCLDAKASVPLRPRGDWLMCSCGREPLALIDGTRIIIRDKRHGIRHAAVVDAREIVRESEQSNSGGISAPDASGNGQPRAAPKELPPCDSGST